MTIKNDDDHPLAIGESGQTSIKAPHVTTSYYQWPKESLKAFTVDGFLRTRDIGSVDVRQYTLFADPKKNMVIDSRFKVNPNDLENVIFPFPGMVVLAAVGIA